MKVYTPFCYIDISIFLLYKHLYIVRHETLTFRLPFGGQGIPWICLKKGPQIYLNIGIDVTNSHLDSRLGVMAPMAISKNWASKFLGA